MNKRSFLIIAALLIAACLSPLCPAQESPGPGRLKLHGIFASDMVLQRGKPITVWGWAEHGPRPLSVQAGGQPLAARSPIIHVLSPLVKPPVAVRYAWATSPMGNLKVNGHPSQPFPKFRTDTWEWPESEDPDESLVRPKEKAIVNEAADRCEFRRTEEAKAAVQILERLRTLGQVKK